MQFCGSQCWKTPESGCRAGGGDTVRALFPPEQVPLERGKQAETILDGRAIIVRRMHGCIGACGRAPAARVKKADGSSNYFTASSPDAVREAVEHTQSEEGAE
jgi:hypothetical protein